MKVRVVFWIFMLCWCQSLMAAESSEIHLSFGKGFGIASQESGEQAVQLHAVRLHPVLPSIGVFQLGYGLRLTHFSADQILGSPFAVTALNAGIQAAFGGIPGLELGMNIDMIGFSLGDSTTKRFNLLLGGKNDKGFLSSEFFVMTRFLDTAFLRLGFAHLATEQTPNAIGRRQDFTDLLMLSFGWVFK